MHHKTKESAVKKYSPLKPKAAELLQAIKDDENKWSEEEVQEIFDAIYVNSDGKIESKAAPIKGNVAFNDFDYNNLKGKPWEEYHEIYKGLVWDDKYDFEEYDCTALKAELYPGMPGSPTKVIGIKLNKDKPLKVTRIKVKDANILNAQIETDWAMQGHGRYFLIKQSK